MFGHITRTCCKTECCAGSRPEASAPSQQSRTAQKPQAADPAPPKAAGQQQTKAAKAAAKKPAKTQRKVEKKGKKVKGRASIQDPTQQEMKAAFALLNPTGRSVINGQDILQVFYAAVTRFSAVSILLHFAYHIALAPEGWRPLPESRVSVKQS